MQMTSTVTTKGQVLIPVFVRNKLNIKPFDRVVFDILGSKIQVQKAATTGEMFGFVKSQKKLTDRQLEKAINKAMEEGMTDHL